jgi:imidazole glycerol-phosphate synthase subunit HisH
MQRIPGGIIIIDYGMGNLRSVQKAFERIRLQAAIVSDPSQVRDASKIILPGVGHFAKGMKHLNESGMADAIKEEALARQKPVLGICLGMQLLTKFSEEGDCEGLGLVDAETIHFPPASDTLKIPHMGWNEIKPVKESALLAGIKEECMMYFVHSYYVKCNQRKDVLFSADYGITFDAGFEHDNIVGFQFHPEKSYKAGLQLLNNFLTLY